jgi:hypothetical protein
MDAPLFRCSRLACAAKGAQPIDKFGVKWDGTRVQMCLSCSVRLYSHQPLSILLILRRKGIERVKLPIAIDK